MGATNVSSPKLRFKKYADSWKQHKLEDYLNVSIEKNTKNIYGKNDVLSVSRNFGIVNQIEFQGRSYAGVSVSNYGIVKNGYIVYTKSPLNANPYGIIKTNKGKTGIVSTLYAVYSCKENTCPDFIQTYFDLNSRMNLYMHPLVNKGAKNDMKVSSENALKGNVIFPEYLEQQQIGTFFNNLDDLITLYQNKCDKLMNVKKSMLEKMFPKDGKNVPEIRFEGFTGAWKQLAFGDIVTPYADPVPTPKDGYTRLGILSHAKGTFHEYVKPGMELETAQMHKVAADKFIVNITFGWEHAVAITDENDAGKLVSHRFPQYSFNNGMMPQYFKYCILDESFRHHLWLASPGGAGRNRVLNLNEMLEYKFWVPSVEEQIRISEFLRNLDELITLNQHKLKKLIDCKQAFLVEMFGGEA